MTFGAAAYSLPRLPLLPPEAICVVQPLVASPHYLTSPLPLSNKHTASHSSVAVRRSSLPGTPICTYIQMSVTRKSSECYTGIESKLALSLLTTQAG